MPETSSLQDRITSSSPTKSPSTLLGSSFWQRREDIFRRVEESADQCRCSYNERKELATEKDEVVAEFCEALEDAFSYGLRQPECTVAVTAASFLQNMQEIVTGNIGGLSNSSAAHSSDNDSNTFWDFCQIHLTQHERERYENLKHIWTKCGRGRAFIRATLNENSLQRYLLTWLSAEEELRRFYAPWSVLLDMEAAKKLPRIVGSLKMILFALTVDSVELNVPRNRSIAVAPVKEEPIIYAPSPVPVVGAKNKRKTNAVERPITTANSTEDLINSLQNVIVMTVAQNTSNNNTQTEFEDANEELMAEIFDTPPDPIEPELEFLKHPLPDFYPMDSTYEQEYEDKSDTSSQYSKSSSTVNGSTNQTTTTTTTAATASLEEKLRETEERCLLLETRVAQLSLENRQLTRRLTQHFKESGIDPSSSLATNFLITIPNVKLIKPTHGSSFYTYEIHITMRQRLEHWSIQRRYHDFYKLHKSLLRTHPSVNGVEFPPKKRFGNMNMVFVEERRQQLQIYLLNLVETLPQVEACKSKVELQKVFPFVRDR